MGNRFVSASILFSSLVTSACGLERITDYYIHGDTQVRRTHDLHRCSSLLKRNSGFQSQTYGTCSEIQADTNDVKQYYTCLAEEDRLSGKSGVQVLADSASVAKKTASSVPESAAGSMQGDISTNLRENGVDEGDFVKISDDQIFVASADNTIQVIERSSRKHTGSLILPSLEQNGEVAQFGLLRTSGASNRANIQTQLFVVSDRLVVLRGSFVMTFEISSGQLPHLLQSKLLPASISDARVVGDRLVIAGNSQQDWSPERRFGRPDLNCASVVKPFYITDLANTQLTSLMSLSVRDLSDFSESLHPGRFSIYMTSKSVYLYSSDSPWGTDFGRESTQIRKVSLSSDGRFGDAVQGSAKGRIKDVWAISELSGGELAVATSTGNLWNGTAKNHFEVFSARDNRLDKIGETEDYGAKEDIRSVRFVGTTAYVVTFKKTDPLYAIDISVPSAPRILGELKIPGFSSYMHPLSADRMIGLGFDAMEMGELAYYQGLQVSLFDTVDPMNMSRKDVRILGVRGTSSAATSDHKAFYMDANEKIIGFPVSELNICQDLGACQSSVAAQKQLALGRTHFSGAVIYKINGDQLGDEIRLSHTDLMSERCRSTIVPAFKWWQDASVSQDIQRIFKLSGEIVTVSRGALKTFRMGSSLEETGSARWNSECD
jgi:hypothetical protein